MYNEIEQALKKLRPILPQAVDRWTKSRSITEPDVRMLLDRHILATARFHLGNWHERTLLSNPPKSMIDGKIKLGTVEYNGPQNEFGLNESEILQHIGIFGRSGSGKTNLTFQILKQLMKRKIPVLYLDWKRTARHLLPELDDDVQVFTPGRKLSPLQWNPFTPPPNLERHIFITQLEDLLASAYTLGDGARTIVRQALETAYAMGNMSPSAKDLLIIIDGMPSKGRVSGWKVTARRAIDSLRHAGIGEGGTTQNLDSLLNQSTIVELDGLADSTKRFYVPLLCLWVYYALLARRQREQLTIVIVIEEAHNIFYKQERGRESVMDMILRQCRELGIGIIVVDQQPSLLSDSVLANTYASIFLNLKHPSDVRKASGIAQLNEQDARSFYTLPIGQAIVKLQARWYEPFLIQIPLINVRKGSVSDEALTMYIHSTVSGTTAGRVNRVESQRVPQVPSSDKLVESVHTHYLEPDAVRLLQHTVDYPFIGVRKRYADLSISVGSGNRLKQRLLKLGYLQQDIVHFGKTRTLLLRPSIHVSQQLNLRNGVSIKYNESMVHAYWKHHYAQELAGYGYVVQLEAPRVGGRIDILGTKGEKRIGVEIETGESNFEKNIRNGLESELDDIFVVATNSEVCRQLNSILEKIRQGTSIPIRCILAPDVFGL